MADHRLYAAAETTSLSATPTPPVPGAGSYGDSGGCKRSANAYAQFWANANAPSSFSFVACSGATTDDVLANQVSALTADTALVTISIGGNDAGFADVMTDCNLGSDATCVSAQPGAQDYAQHEAARPAGRVYTEIRNRAPSARSSFSATRRSITLERSCSVGLSETKRAAINASADVLAEVISGRAGAFGFTLRGRAPSFAGHEICASGARWINSITWPIDESYHPNAAGQATVTTRPVSGPPDLSRVSRAPAKSPGPVLVRFVRPVAWNFRRRSRGNPGTFPVPARPRREPTAVGWRVTAVTLVAGRPSSGRAAWPPGGQAR